MNSNNTTLLKQWFLILCAVLITGTNVSAQVADTTITEKKGFFRKGAFSFSGSLDTYYSYNFNKPGPLENGGTTGVGRIFDLEHNRIAFGMLRTMVAYETEKTEIVGELAFGPAAELANFGNTGTSILIKQAYIKHSLGKKFSFKVGQFGTHIGYELVDANANFNYSLSYLFGNGPFYHTGLLLNYAFSDKVQVMAGIVNGWDNISDNNKGKSFVGQLALSPSDDFELYLNWIGGNEDGSEITGDSTKSYKQMVDLTSTYSVTEKFNIGVNAAFGTYKFDNNNFSAWGGAALYLNYNFTDLFAIGTRVEYFDDDRGVQYLGAKYTGLTLTGIFTLANGAVLIKPEIRHDRSNKNIYSAEISGPKTNGEVKFKKYQTTAGIAVIGVF
ncbi:MAG: porin [Chitinophagales bacterium]